MRGCKTPFKNFEIHLRGWLEKTPSTWLDFFINGHLRVYGWVAIPFPTDTSMLDMPPPPPPQSEHTTMRKRWYILVPNPIDRSNYSLFHIVQKTDFLRGDFYVNIAKKKNETFTKFWYNLFHGEIQKVIWTMRKGEVTIFHNNFIGRHDRVRVCMGRETTART